MILRGGGGFGDGACDDELGGVVLEDAGWLAGGVADDRAACGIACVLADFRGGEGGTIGEAHVAVEPLDPHGIVGRHRVDPVAARELTAPIRVVPDASEDPCAGGDRCRERFDAGDELRGCLCIAEIDIRPDRIPRIDRSARASR